MGLEHNGATKRAISFGAEDWLGKVQPVLNGGEIELVEQGEIEYTKQAYDENLCRILYSMSLQ